MVPSPFNRALFCPFCLPGEAARPDCPMCGHPKPVPASKEARVYVCAACAERRRRDSSRHTHRLERGTGSQAPEATQRADASFPETMNFKTGTLELGRRVLLGLPAAD